MSVAFLVPVLMSPWRTSVQLEVIQSVVSDLNQSVQERSDCHVAGVVVNRTYLGCVSFVYIILKK